MTKVLRLIPLFLVAAFPRISHSQPACPEWKDSHTATVEVGPGADLVQAVRNAASGTTLLLLPGTYKISASLQFMKSDVTLRSKSGNRADVILDGNGGGTPLNSSSFVPELVAISASRVTIADVSIRYARDHGVHAYPPASGNITGLRLRNVHVYDCGQQLIKVNSNGGNPASWVDSGTVECSHIGFQDNSVMESSGDGFYTGGIDLHGGQGWLVRANLFKNIQRQGKLMEHGVHMWSKSRGNVIENNRFEDVYRAIGLGMKTAAYGPERHYPDKRGDAPYFDHLDGVVRNNVIFNRTGILLETGIELMNVEGVEVYNNTVVSQDKPFSSIEYRWPNTRVTVKNNLVSHNILSRESAVAVTEANLQNAGAALFAGLTAGNLKLSATAALAINKGAKLASGKADLDHDWLVRDALPDIGAYEFQTGGPVKGLPKQKGAAHRAGPALIRGQIRMPSAAEGDDGEIRRMNGSRAIRRHGGE